MGRQTLPLMPRLKRPEVNTSKVVDADDRVDTRADALDYLAGVDSDLVVSPPYTKVYGDSNQEELHEFQV